MKRAKIMLLTIAIIATVGGALAFKAQKFGLFEMYTSTVVGGAQTCTIYTTSSLTSIKPTPAAISVGSYYTTTNGASGTTCLGFTTAYVDPL
jgi:hypothetical protein